MLYKQLRACPTEGLILRDLFAGMPCESVDDSCPGGYEWYAGEQLCLYQIPHNLTWAEARLRCRELNGGAGDLLVKTDDDIINFIKSHFV